MKKLYFLLSVLFFMVTGTVSAQVVINEVYGGGGNAGATYKNDFIELYNNGSSAVSLTGWSVQYASSAGSSWTVTALSASIPAHSFYLVQELAGAGGTTNLPTPDVTGTINMSGTAGKVILCNTTVAQTGASPTGAQIIDIVGFGSTAYFEGTGPTPAPSNTTSVQRTPIGKDSDNNSADFTTGAPSPSNSSTSTGGPTVSLSASTLSGFSTTAGVASAPQTVTAGGTSLTSDITITPSGPYEVSIDGGTTYSASPLTLTQTGGTVNNTVVNIRITATAPSGAANGSADFSSAGATTKSVTLTGTVGAVVSVDPPVAFSAAAVSTTEIDLSATANAANNNIVVATNSTATFGTPTGALVAGNTISGGGTVLYSGPSSGFPFANTGLSPGTKYFYQAWSVDGSNTYSTTLAANATTNNPPAANIVINQVYGGGGNSGATFKNDFIELYNNESAPVNLSGWSVQYSSAAGTGSWQVHALSGTIPAHSFFLIQEVAGAGGTVNLPTPDVTGTLALSATAGKVILSNSITAQTGANPAGATVIDKVGFGPTATGFETSPTAATDNTTSIQRVTDGVDNNNNSTDFFVDAPIPRNSTYTTTPPHVLSLTPPNSTTDVPSNISLSMVFDKKIMKGSGSITIYANGVAGTPIDVNDAGVVISNNSTVAIPATLTPGTSYYILISAGAFADVYGNSFAGISSTTAWAFTTYNSSVATTLPATFDFQNCTGNGLLPNGFTQYSTIGAQIWDCTTFGRDPNAPAGTTAFPNAVQMNGYANNINNLNKDWLISPKLDLSGTAFPLLSFWSRNAFDGAPLELKVSTDYTGSGDPALATWTDINGKFPSSGSDTWKQSGGINLSAFKQSSVYIAWVYSSTTDDGARWTLDDISLINSLTPPPPSLTLSASNLEFGYTAAGGSSVKSLTLTGNDLTGDVTLTISGNFDVSTDGTTFGPSATIAQAVANDVPQTIYVRFSPVTNNIQYSETLSVAISDSTGTVNLKGNSIDPASTLNVIDWNLNWFATPNQEFGPPNKSLQQDNVAIVLKSLPADLFVLQEVVNQHALDSIVNTMPGYSYIINNYGSYSNPTLHAPDPLTEVQKLAFVYKTSKFSNIHTDSLLTLGVTTAADTLLNPYYNAFASGRFPYMMSADVTLSDNNGGFITHPMRFINVHAKANTAPVLTAYDRRVAGAKGLDSLIKADYINENVIVLGDLNDDLNQTITAGVTPPVSSWYPFTVTDSPLYIFPTKPLSPAGQHSDVSFTSVIDNVIATAATAKYYLPASATVLSDVANLVPKYGTTTTDHYPVFTQYSFSTQAALPVKLTGFKAVKQNNTVQVSWTTSQEENSKLFDVERSTDGSHFISVGTVSAKGTSSVKTDYSFNDKQPLSGISYYRLKQVDQDDKFVYSSVAKINFIRGASIHITPNPASGFINVSLENINTAANLQIIDLNGKLVKQQLITQGTANKSVSLAGLSKGLYTVKLVSSENVTTQKLVIQ